MEILLPKMKYTHEIVGTYGGALLPERAPGACSGFSPAAMSVRPGYFHRKQKENGTRRTF